MPIRNVDHTCSASKLYLYSYAIILCLFVLPFFLFGCVFFEEPIPSETKAYLWVHELSNSKGKIQRYSIPEGELIQENLLPRVYETKPTDNRSEAWVLLYADSIISTDANYWILANGHISLERDMHLVTLSPYGHAVILDPDRDALYAAHTILSMNTEQTVCIYSDEEGAMHVGRYSVDAVNQNKFHSIFKLPDTVNIAKVHPTLEMVFAFTDSSKFVIFSFSGEEIHSVTIENMQSLPPIWHPTEATLFFVKGSEDFWNPTYTFTLYDIHSGTSSFINSMDSESGTWITSNAVFDCTGDTVYFYVRKHMESSLIALDIKKQNLRTVFTQSLTIDDYMFYPKLHIGPCITHSSDSLE